MTFSVFAETKAIGSSNGKRKASGDVEKQDSIMASSRRTRISPRWYEIQQRDLEVTKVQEERIGHLYSEFLKRLLCRFLGIALYN
jgi:hypothetical protein